MLAKVFSVTHLALQTLTVEVEVNAGRGKPNIYLVGLPNKAVQESEQRVKTALQNCGIHFPAKKITINLAPADILKEGPLFDLPIAIGILTALEYIQLQQTRFVFLGELSLDGHLRPVKGVLPAVIHARAQGFTHIVIPAENASEVEIISGITIHPVKHIIQLMEYFEKKSQLPELVPRAFTGVASTSLIDFADVAGQQVAKRALEIAAAGSHNVLMNGSPGSGKSMLAKAMVSILPPLNEQEAIEVTTIYSISGLTSKGLIASRPFRSPHHTISQIGLVGGGNRLRPGEISLAHRGVLFLDEFAEFSHSSLESLRQPLEDHAVHIARAAGATQYPAHFTLVAATNPCPCGYLLSKKRMCSCNEFAIDHYRQKLSGPILDRIDLHVHVHEVESAALLQKEPQTVDDSRTIQARIIAARDIQKKKLANTTFLTNGELDTKSVKQLCPLSIPAKLLLEQATEKFQMTARGFFKLIKVAQTIADLESVVTGKPATPIERHHLAEALQYRSSQLKL